MYSKNLQNGATNLTSGTGAIAITGVVESKNGFIALAKQDITTGKIQSGQGVVILNTHQGAITVNGTISSYGDISLAAPEDVVAQEITSGDGGVALISARGTVTANGAIASMEDVTLGAKENVVAQTINAQLGTVALVSTEGTVTTNGTISGGIEVVISAKQGVSAGQIFGGTVAINSERGIVTLTGNVISGGGNVYLSASGNVISRNIISQGGAITVVSEQGAIAIGYLRSDGYGAGGKIYLQAFGSIRVISPVTIGDIDYSIYTGINKKGWITIVPQSSVLKLKNKAKFVIGDAKVNGTLAQVSSPPIIPAKPLPTTKPGIGLGAVILEIFRRILDAGPTAPPHVDEINPITNEPYSDVREHELVKKLNPAQRGRLKELINKTTDREELLKKEEFRRGEVDDRGCFSVELGIHLGTFLNHSLYAIYITIPSH